MEDQQWYIKTKSGQRGPYSKQQLQRYIDAGALRPNAGIGDGDGHWVAASTVAGLSFPASSATEVAAHATTQAATAAAQQEDSLNERLAELSERERSVRQQQDETRRKAEALEAERQAIADAREQLDADRLSFQATAQQFDQQRQQHDQQLDQQRRLLDETAADLDRREQQLDEREQSLARLEQSLQQRESDLQTRETEFDRRRDEPADEQQAAETVVDGGSTTAAEAPGVRDLLAEKRKLLEEFARRQESLSRREADLIRRENELTRRELDITKLPPMGAAHDIDVEPEPAAADPGSDREAGGGAELHPPQAASQEPVVETAEPDAASDSEDEPQAPPRSWGEFLDSRATARAARQDSAAAESQPESDADAPAAVGESKPKATSFAVTESTADLSAGPAERIAFRNRVYEQRFGPRTECLIDEDPQMRVDLSIHAPHGGREFNTLVTNGMSDYPIAMPNGQRSVRAELVLYATHVDETALQILRTAAKLPYKKKQGLSIGTTGSFSELSTSFSGSKLTDCVYLLPVVESDSKPIGAKEQLGSSIQLFWLVAITEAERKLIENGGIHRFLSLLEKNGHGVYFDLTRDCYVKRKGWFRRDERDTDCASRITKLSNKNRSRPSPLWVPLRRKSASSSQGNSSTARWRFMRFKSATARDVSCGRMPALDKESSKRGLPPDCSAAMWAAVANPNRRSDQAICGSRATAGWPPAISLSKCLSASAALPDEIASLICQIVLPCQPATMSRTSDSPIVPPGSR